MMIDELVKD